MTKESTSVSSFLKCRYETQDLGIIASSDSAMLGGHHSSVTHQVDVYREMHQVYITLLSHQIHLLKS